jgi:hypothetical protein
MDATIRATCPSCRSSLKIPAQWAGQAVKCKKCGAVVRTKTKPPSPAAGTTEAARLDVTGTHTPPAAAVPAPPHFAGMTPPALAAPTPVYKPFDPAGEPVPQPLPYDPNAYLNPPPNGAYPVPPGAYPYPAPPAAPGYPAAGYPYPAPPGYPAPVPPGYPYPIPPSYPQPVGYDPQQAAYPYPAPVPAPAYAASLPEAASVGADFAPSEATQAFTGRGRKYQRGGSGKGKYVWIGVALVLTAGLVAGGIYGVKYVKELAGKGPDGTTPGDPTKPGQPGTPGSPAQGSGLTASGGPFPRRMLFIHVSNYLYLNPLTATGTSQNSKGPDLTKPAANRLGYEWRVPPEQVYVVSDTAAGQDQRNPMRSVITGAYEQFFATSRAQDRIVVYFGGHVLSKKQDDKDVTYLVPMEGDPDDPATLIPLAEFYDKLKACPATQKVVIWDVSRFNPERGRQRPGSEPMTAETAAALAAAPPGVQVVTTCQADENALEFDNLQPDGPNRVGVAGSNFLEATRYAAGKNRTAAKNLGPNDPIPVDDWAAAVGKRVNDVAVFNDPKGKQTVKVSGGLPAELVAFNKDEALPPRFALPTPPKGVPVTDLVAEFALPPIDNEGSDLGVANFPFPENAIAEYKSDVPLAEIMANREKYLLRVHVLETFETIRKLWGTGGGEEKKELLKKFTGKTDDAMKKQVLEQQLFPAEAIPRLEQAIILLEADEPMKAAEPKRWQAHYEYALAQAKARLAFMHEYNLALGSIRTEVLPPMKPGDDGYKLVAAEKMKVKKEAKYAEEAQEHYDKIIADYKGTPWAIQAKRDRAMSLGLAWQSFNSKEGKTDPDEKKDP